MVNATSRQQDSSFLPTLEIFLQCFIIFVVKERSPEILFELNLSLCDILEISIFSCTHFIHLIVIA